MKFLKINHTDKLALVDNEDFERLNKFEWYYYKHRENSDRICRYRNRKSVSLANEVMQLYDNYLFDHKNSNRFDNQKSNLRHCNNQENNFNRSKIGGSSSVYIGIWIDKKSINWPIKASIKHNGKTIFIGSFKTEIEAAKARDIKAKELFGEFAKLNFP